MLYMVPQKSYNCHRDALKTYFHRGSPPNEQAKLSQFTPEVQKARKD